MISKGYNNKPTKQITDATSLYYLSSGAILMEVKGKLLFKLYVAELG